MTTKSRTGEKRIQWDFHEITKIGTKVLQTYGPGPWDTTFYGLVDRVQKEIMPKDRQRRIDSNQACVSIWWFCAPVVSPEARKQVEKGLVAYPTKGRQSGPKATPDIFTKPSGVAAPAPAPAMPAPATPAPAPAPAPATPATPATPAPAPATPAPATPAPATAAPRAPAHVAPAPAPTHTHAHAASTDDTTFSAAASWDVKQAYAKGLRDGRSAPLNELQHKIADFISNTLVESAKKFLTDPAIARAFHTLYLSKPPEAVLDDSPPDAPPIRRHNPIAPSEDKQALPVYLVCGYRGHQTDIFQQTFPELRFKFWFSERPGTNIGPLEEKCKNADYILFQMSETSHTATAIAKKYKKRVYRVTGGLSAMLNTIAAIDSNTALDPKIVEEIK